MKEFLAGIFFALLLVVPVVAALIRKRDRKAGSSGAKRIDIDGELSRLTGELAH